MTGVPGQTPVRTRQARQEEMRSISVNGLAGTGPSSAAQLEISRTGTITAIPKRSHRPPGRNSNIQSADRGTSSKMT